MQQSQPADQNTRVHQAIRRAAETTGAGFDYLLRTASRESALDPAAKARTSSATGLFQFVEQTWLAMVKEEGPRLGMVNAAAAIDRGPGGDYRAKSPALKEAILKLREHPETAAALAAAFTERNRAALSNSLGRQPNDGELYAAHVFGQRGASLMLQTAATRPDTAAAKVLPEAAAANRSIFYDSVGRPRSVAGVLALLAGDKGVPAPTMPASVPALAAVKAQAEEAEPLTVAAFAPEDDCSPFHSIFHTGRRSPIAGYIASAWSSLPERPAPSHPLSRFAEVVATHPPSVPTIPQGTARTTADAPTAEVPTASAVQVRPPRKKTKAAGAPLDLLAFLKPAVPLPPRSSRTERLKT
jgi:hypothetical protein